MEGGLGQKFDDVWSPQLHLLISDPIFQHHLVLSLCKMISRGLPRVSRLIKTPRAHPTTLIPQSRANPVSALRRSSPVLSRSFYVSASKAKGLQPDSEDPKPPKTHSPVAGAAVHVTEPSPLSPQEYYDYSEHYFNVLIAEIETMQEDQGSEIEAEYSVCWTFISLLFLQLFNLCCYSNSCSPRKVLATMPLTYPL